MSKDKQTVLQKRFVEEYLIDMNAAQAAIRAGYSPNAAKQQGYKLLANPFVRNQINEEMGKLSEMTAFNRERIFQELLNLAYMKESDIQAFTNQGEKAAFTSVKIKKIKNEEGETIQREVKVDRLKALELLLKYFGTSGDKANKHGFEIVRIIDDIPRNRH